MLKQIYGCWLSVLTSLFGIDFAKKTDAYLRFKRSRSVYGGYLN